MAEIRQVGDLELRRPAAPVRRAGRTVRDDLELMAATMAAVGGVGLAATQVGLNRRLAVIDVGEGRLDLVNPEVVRSEGQTVAWEGCLSVPEVMGRVTRAERVTVRAMDGRGRTIWVEGEGLLARALQHEIDHLDGILFVDRAEELDYHDELKGAPGEPVRRRGGPEAATPTMPLRAMRIVFMGTSAFAVPALTVLAQPAYNVVGVVSQPDRPAGRGGRLQAPPVKLAALERGLAILQPGRVDVVGDELARWKPDLVVTAAFGQFLPRRILDLPTRGCVNLHASLLPRHRGAAPIQRALLAGDAVTGVSLHYIDEGMDTGDVILRRQVPIAPDATGGALHDRLADLAAGLVREGARLIARGVVPRLAQDESQATRAPRLGPEDEVLVWQRPAVELERRVRALSPAPGAHVLYDGRRLKVWRAAVGRDPGAPGEILAVEGDTLRVATGDGSLILEVVQPGSGRMMSAGAFARGRRLQPGMLIGS
ncbi:MAG TPA: methionyl-tRNA formyltransferase [Clostridiales bacterium]|nr:methionyl-tRNA formyltransferase [Clostridiales bacterium]